MAWHDVGAGGMASLLRFSAEPFFENGGVVSGGGRLACLDDFLTD